MSRILVVDDDEALRLVLRGILEQMGHEVVLAGNGHEALASQEASPASLMLTDIFMPEMEGLETIQEIRKAYPQMKIVAMSAGAPRAGGADYLTMARRFGASRVLAKPFTREALAEALKEAGLGS